MKLTLQQLAEDVLALLGELGTEVWLHPGPVLSRRDDLRHTGISHCGHKCGRVVKSPLCK